MKKIKIIVVIIFITILFSGCDISNLYVSKDKNGNSTVGTQEDIKKHMEEQQKKEKEISNKAKEIFSEKADKSSIYKILDYSTAASNNGTTPFYGLISYKNENNELDFISVGRDINVYIIDNVDTIKGNYLLIKYIGDDKFYYIITEKTKVEMSY